MKAAARREAIGDRLYIPLMVLVAIGYLLWLYAHDLGNAVRARRRR